MTQNEIYMSRHKESFHEGNFNIRYHFWTNKPVGNHQHDFFEMFIVTENRILHTFNGQSAIIEKGTLCLIRPGDTHQVKSPPCETSAHFSLSIAQSAFEELCRLLSPDLYDLIMHQSQLISYKLTKPEYEYFQYSILEKLHPAKTMTSIAMAMAHMLLAYLQIQLTSMKSTQLNYPQWFSEFLDKLSSPDVFCQPLSQIYSLSPYSQTRLNTLFNQYKGMTLIEYVTRQKVNYACTLLTATNYKISYISDTAGFNSLSGFNHAFKRIIGVSPSQFQKENRANWNQS